MAEADSPSKVSNEDFIENGLIIVQQLFAEQMINGTERDHIKGMLIISNRRNKPKWVHLDHRIKLVNARLFFHR